MRILSAFTAIASASILAIPSAAMPSEFKDLDNSTWCSIGKGHTVVTIDDTGATTLRKDQNVCLTINKIEDVWKVRFEWWSIPLNKRFVEHALAGWINPKTLAYKESASNINNSKIIGEGHIRFVDKNTINLLQYGTLEDGSAAMLSENLTRASAIPRVNIPLHK